MISLRWEPDGSPETVRIPGAWSHGGDPSFSTRVEHVRSRLPSERRSGGTIPPAREVGEPLIAATVLCAALAAAEIAVPPEAERTYRVWTVDDGLAQGSVFALEQTPDGYLWIATLDGLVRYDGASLRRFSRSDHPGLGSNRILALHVDREGSLWIGTEDGGAARMTEGAFRSFGAAEGRGSAIFARS